MSSTNALFRAVRGGLVDELRELLQQPDVDVNCKDVEEQTALHYAAQHIQLPIVEVLLENGADVNSRDYHNNTPLLRLMIGFSEGNKVEIAELLLSRENVDVDALNDSGETAFKYAATKGDYEIARLLLNTNKVDINRQYKTGSTALALATENKQIRVVELLLQYGAIRSLRDDYGRTAQAIAQDHAMFGETLDHSIMALFGRMPSTLATTRMPGYPLPLGDELQLRELVSLSFIVVGPKGCLPSTFIAPELSFPPKDRLSSETETELQGIVRQLLERGPEKNGTRWEKPWLWVHVPSNNVSVSGFHAIYHH